MKSEFDRYDTEIATLVVDADMRGREPLRDCVRQSIETYFETLSGQSASGLYQMVLAEVEKPLIETVMNHTAGNQTHAADILGLSRGTLRKKLAEHHIT